ncbi:hypothetical protein R1flu_023611 [Riccia fluitans]|uniref:Ubiquitin-like protease family profile domain-containing protein n=1 Tax=Riccia fluitans TaxID=41844 RepID=A0ABD1XSK7_9MARC
MRDRKIKDGLVKTILRRQTWSLRCTKDAIYGDVINMYINEAFLKKPHKQLHNMFYVNTFWFTKANELVAKYDKTNHAEEAMIKITRLWKSICPELHDEDMQGNLPTWIFVPIHGKNHWSFAIIRLYNDDAWLAHLDSF